MQKLVNSAAKVVTKIFEVHLHFQHCFGLERHALRSIPIVIREVLRMIPGSKRPVDPLFDLLDRDVVMLHLL